MATSDRYLRVGIDLFLSVSFSKRSLAYSSIAPEINGTFIN